LNWHNITVGGKKTDRLILLRLTLQLTMVRIDGITSVLERYMHVKKQQQPANGLQ
jgi:hypothetical protein